MRVRTGQRLYMLAFALALYCMGAGFVRLWSSLDQPFGGFIWQYDDVLGYSVSYEVPRHWTGPVAGLTQHTTILAINGRPAEQFPLVYAEAKPGIPVIYTVATPQGQLQEISVPVMRFGFTEMFEAYGFIALAGLTFALAGLVLVWTAERQGRVLLAFLLLSGAIPAFYHSHNGHINTFYDCGPYFATFWAPNLAVYGTMLWHAALTFPRRLPLITRYPRIIIVSYGVAIMLGVMLGIAFSTGEQHWAAALQRPLMLTTISLVLTGAVATLIRGVVALVWQRTQLSSTEIRQVRMLMVAWGLTMLVLLGTTGAAVLRVPAPINEIALLAMTLPIGLTYAIRNLDLIAHLEAENTFRAELLQEVREVHTLQERVLGELADEIHDGPPAEGKALEVELFMLATNAKKEQIQPSCLAALTARLHGQSLGMIRMLRQIVEGAKPVDFEQDALGTALKRILLLREAVSDSIAYTLEVAPNIELLPPNIKNDVYWMVRAALNNVRDHAHAKHCTVIVIANEVGTVVTICDDGCGFDSKAQSPYNYLPRPLGLASIRSRAARLDGSVEIESSSRGTSIVITIPSCSHNRDIHASTFVAEQPVFVHSGD